MEEVRFGLLGNLEVRTDIVVRPLFAPMHRMLVASLLCRANQVVAGEQLADTLWCGHPPGGASATLRGYVMRVRRALGPAGCRIETVAPGYRINLDPERELDAARFVALCRSGLAAGGAGRWEISAALLDESLALWRGEPLQDVPCERLRDRELPSLLEAHVQAEQTRLQAEVELGRPGAALTGLRRIVAAHPLWERPHALLMRALDGCDRRAEALEVFRDLRVRLIRELGIEPSRELQDLHRAILGGRRETIAARPVREPVRTPFTLPASVDDFTDREAEVASLAASLTQARSQGGAALAHLDGMAGVGKTTLAFQVGHLLRDRFPDGQLFGRLRGAGSRPAQPGEVLAMFLRLLGVDPALVPPDHEERAALYRSLLNGRRVLIVLDDARDTAQVRPLLPASAGNAVLITARARTIALPGAGRSHLDVLRPPAARLLLERIVGAQRLAAEPQAAREVLGACAGLPLAIRIAGTRLAGRPHWRVRDLAGRLTSARSRLQELSHDGDAVRAVFEAGYRGLAARADAPRAAAEAFRALGLWPGPELSIDAAASMIGVGEDETEHALEFLVDMNMAWSPGPGRYALHALVRDYAGELAVADVPPELAHGPGLA